jgi:hypothetical protein
LTDEVLYQRVCDSYQAVDDFRTKLLGLLPVATGTGVFILLSGKADLLRQARQSELAAALAAIGAFGLLFTLGLFSYELFGTKKCHYLISCGRRIEDDLGLEGQFRSRPPSLARFINEPFAASIIYPACMAAWAYVAIFFSSGPRWAAVVALAILLVGISATLGGLHVMKERADCDERVYVTIRDKGPLSSADLHRDLGSLTKERVVDAAVERLTEADRIVKKEAQLEVRSKPPLLSDRADRTP